MPTPKPAELPGVVMVDLVALAAPAAAGKPASLPKPAQPKPPSPPPASKPIPPAPAVAEVPKPEAPKPEPPKPEPPKPPPPRNETVIPKTPQREPEKPKAKPEPDPKPDPKPRTDPKPTPKEVAKAEAPKPPPTPPKAKPQESYDDVLAGLRAERGEDRPDPVERPTRTASAAKPGAAGSAAAPGTLASGSASVSPEIASWLRAVRLHVGQAWVLPEGLRRERLETQVEVELDAKGNVLSEPKVTRRSGNPWYDESVVRAIQKASPLPPPPEPGRQAFVFRPEDPV